MRRREFLATTAIGLTASAQGVPPIAKIEVFPVEYGVTWFFKFFTRSPNTSFACF